jgi:hypothetical protein
MRNLKAIFLAGLASLGGVPLAQAVGLPANLVLNPGFETGDFTGWTVGGNTTSPGAYYGVNCTDGFQNSGSCAAFFAEPTTATTLAETLTLAPSTTYTVSFYLSQLFAPSSSYPNSWSVSFDGSTLDSGSNLPDANGVYSLKSYTFTTAASGNSGLLQFSFLDSAGFYFLDDVSVSASVVPEMGSLSLMLSGLGLFALGGAARRRRSVG